MILKFIMNNIKKTETYMKFKKIVCFGGGSATPRVILEPLKKYPVEISSVTSMTDDGGSTGQLRKELGVLPPGDIRRHILAFSSAPQWKKKLWRFRFGNEEFEDGHKGHSFANVFMAGLEKNMKNYAEVLDECCRFMEVDKKYKPLPAIITKTVLCAELENGQIIEGESEIDIPGNRDAALKIKKIFLKPQARAYKEVLPAIEKADALIFGPGDLYSSILPCLLPAGIKRAIFKSRAKKIFVCNIMNKNGETNNFFVEDFANEVEKYIGAELDYVLYNKNIPGENAVRKAGAEDASSLEPVVLGGSNNIDENKFIGANFLQKTTVFHDPEKTGEVIWRIIN